MSVIFPASPPALGPVQSIHLFPGSPITTWLKTLYASTRNAPLKRSVMLNDLESDRSDAKKCGPRNESRGKLPIVPHAGRAKPVPDGRAAVQKSKFVVPGGAEIFNNGIGVK